MNQYTGDHIENLAILSKNLKNEKLSVYESHYHYLHFGSFTVIIGTSKNRVMFEYDGKDSWLIISQSKFSSSNDPAQWEEVEQKSVAYAEVFPEIEKICMELI